MLWHLPVLRRLRPERAGARILAPLVVLALAASPALGAQEDDPKSFVEFGKDFEAVCVTRESVMVLVRNTHPTRTVRVWLERHVAGVHTGDRGRSELRPGAAPEKLGCSRTLEGAQQEWRIVKAVFVDE